MHLKKLEIQGFKSFPEYTLIEFDEGMTAIVGPNGSGKSNVTDAIRWVLGEQSVRMLRGGKMEDVIFNGTQSRRAMNYAEVSMTLDNSDGVLGVDYTEVQVTRRLYRSGESEYQLNRVNCRLKDIATLFMDTGLGKDGYSIVGQGRVDEILSTRSEDRRKVLEEASGIVKYKARKDEAERKLLSTEQNLVRIEDILAELTNRMEPLRDQAVKAKEYHRIYDEWKELDVGLSLFLIDRNQAFLSASETEVQGLAEEIRRQEDELLTMRQKNRELSEKSSRLEEELEAGRTKATATTEEIHVLQNESAVTSERKRQLAARIDASTDEEGSATSEIDRLNAEKKQQDGKIRSLQMQRDRYAGELAENDREMAQLLSAIDHSEKTITETKRRIEDLQEALFENKENAARLSSDVQLYDGRMKSLSQDRVLAVNESDAFSVRMEESISTLQSLKSAVEAGESELTAAKADLDGMRLQNAELMKGSEDKKRELDNMKFRIRTLEELERSREGYQEPVRRLLQAADTDAVVKRAVKGVLGELIQVSKEFETAIEIALGPALHNIVTENEKDASYLIEYLKTNHLGRVTFLPISVIRSKELEQGYLKTARESEGFKGLASDLITYPPELSGIVGNLLGRICIVDTLPQALKIASKTSQAFRIVTKEGDVVNPGGSMTGGSIRKQGTSLLGRARELQSLKERLEVLENDIREFSSEITNYDEKIREAARTTSLLDQRIRALSVEYIRAQDASEQIKKDKERIESRLIQIDREKDELASKKQLILTEKKENEEAIRRCESEILSLRQVLSSSDTKNREVQEQLDDLRNEISNLRISVGSIEESLRGADEISERISREQKGYLDGLMRRRAERDSAQAEINALSLKEEEIQVRIEELRKTEYEHSRIMKDLLLQKEETEHELSGYIDRLSGITSRLGSLQSEHARLQAKVERFLIESDETKNRLWEDHELTYDNAQSYRLEIDNPQPISRRIGELKTAMKELGSVNLGAVEEFDQVSERHAFMQAQKDDIEAAKNNLSGVINDLIAEMKEQFLTQFAIINENFKSVFEDLFNGGTAEILLEDADDILSCGIDIKAQPPGKKLQSLSLLSGGERCLTAIALLFAILRLRPSPFCVLDEVEAALDDVNVSRFTDFVKRYTAKSQFILVTHRKGTMEACDRMYGVTMQERGISKILSMRLGES